MKEAHISSFSLKKLSPVFGVDIEGSYLMDVTAENLLPEIRALGRLHVRIVCTGCNGSLLCRRQY